LVTCINSPHELCCPATLTIRQAPPHTSDQSGPLRNCVCRCRCPLKGGHVVTRTRACARRTSGVLSWKCAAGDLKHFVGTLLSANFMLVCTECSTVCAHSGWPEPHVDVQTCVYAGGSPMVDMNGTLHGCATMETIAECERIGRTCSQSSTFGRDGIIISGDVSLLSEFVFKSRTVLGLSCDARTHWAHIRHSRYKHISQSQKRFSNTHGEHNIVTQINLVQA
jgi:hypothetical protein